MKSIKNPWLAVNLSMFFPGVGQIYAGERTRGWIIFCAQLALLTFGFWVLFSPYGHTLLGAGFLFAALIIHVMGIIDTYERMTLSRDIQINDEAKRNPWFIVFLTQCIPGLGHLLIRKWIWGIPILLLWIFLTRFAPGYLQVNLVPLLITLTSMHILYMFGNFKKRFSNTTWIIIAFLFLSWFIRFSGAYALFNQFSRPFHIPSASMEPTLRRGDRIIVYDNGTNYLRQGDVIVFADPGTPDDIFIKRIAGMAGDTIQILQGHVLINNKFSNNKTLMRKEYTTEGRFAIKYPFVVPDSMLFVLGDYSDVSVDSRFFGPIPETAVIGRAYKIIWPPDRIGPIK
ncbi:signal peptidase I [candidate division KSB1 bacterium]|nr:signal peptidase I [candidate division KSB1 bacterium]